MTVPSLPMWPNGNIICIEFVTINRKVMFQCNVGRIGPLRCSISSKQLVRTWLTGLVA